MRLSSAILGGDPTALRTVECQYPCRMPRNMHPARPFLHRQAHQWCRSTAWHWNSPLSRLINYASFGFIVPFLLALAWVLWRQTNSLRPVLHAASQLLPAKPSSFRSNAPPASCNRARLCHYGNERTTSLNGNCRTTRPSRRYKPMRSALDRLRHESVF